MVIVRFVCVLAYTVKAEGVRAGRRLVMVVKVALKAGEAV